MKHSIDMLLSSFYIHIEEMQEIPRISALYRIRVVAAIFCIRNTDNDECGDKVPRDLRVLQTWRPKIYEFRK